MGAAWLYRKSWPHSETQCASSTASRDKPRGEESRPCQKLGGGRGREGGMGGRRSWGSLERGEGMAEAGNQWRMGERNEEVRR